MEVVDNSRVLITGSSGMLGSYIDFGIRTSRDTLDILDRDAVLAFVQEHNPTAIIHLAAATDTNRCEEDPAYAYSLNTVGTVNVALAAQAVGAVFVYVSTSRVFGGDKVDPYTETDIPDPKTVYGKSKYLGEVAASLISTEHIIVRGCWLFGGGPIRDNKFFGNILKQLGNDKIFALSDVHGSPTYAKDFIAGIKQLLVEGKRGTFHVNNSGFVTRAEIVDHILKLTNSKTQLETVTRDFYKSGNVLPPNEAISSDSIMMRSWTEALAEYIEHEWPEVNVQQSIKQ